MDFTDDTLLLYADFGVSVTHTPAAGGASTTALAVHDLPGVVIYDGAVSASDHTLRYPTASFPAVARGDTFVVDTVTFRVRDAARALADGAESIVALVKA